MHMRGVKFGAVSSVDMACSAANMLCRDLVGKESYGDYGILEKRLLGLRCLGGINLSLGVVLHFTCKIMNNRGFI